MKFNLHDPVLELDGSVMKQPVPRKETDPPPVPGEPPKMENVNFRIVIDLALRAVNQPATPNQTPPPIPAEEAAKIYALHNKILHSWKVTMETPEKTLIEERAAIAWPQGVLLRGRLHDFLEGNEPMIPLPQEDQDKELEDAPEPKQPAKK